MPIVKLAVLILVVPDTRLAPMSRTPKVHRPKQN